MTPNRLKELTRKGRKIKLWSSLCTWGLFATVVWVVYFLIDNYPPSVYSLTGFAVLVLFAVAILIFMTGIDTVTRASYKYAYGKEDEQLDQMERRFESDYKAFVESSLAKRKTVNESEKNSRSFLDGVFKKAR